MWLQFSIDVLVCVNRERREKGSIKKLRSGIGTRRGLDGHGEWEREGEGEQ